MKHEDKLRNNFPFLGIHVVLIPVDVSTELTMLAYPLHT
jgi:hypothetical protein